MTAKYSGTRGNVIRVAVLANTDSSFDVVTYLDTTEMDHPTAYKKGSDGGSKRYSHCCATLFSTGQKLSEEAGYRLLVLFIAVER